jgi:hypothetical protein
MLESILLILACVAAYILGYLRGLRNGLDRDRNQDWSAE